MNRQQMDERRDSRRTVYKFFVILSLGGMLLAGPVDYLFRDELTGFYSSLALLLLATVCCLLAEVRDLIQRRVVED